MTVTSPLTDDATKLLPCPFCGSEPCPVVQNSERSLHDASGGYWQEVWCESCKVTGLQRKTEDEAIAAWNARTARAAVQPVTGLSDDDMQSLRINSMKPDEIDAAASRHGRIEELVRWFARLARGKANPKWLSEHAFELAYAAALSSPAPRVEGWQPIASAPKDGTWIMTFRVLDSGRPEFATCQWRADWINPERHEWGGDGWTMPDFGPQPTHWISLPAAPASGDA